MAKEIAYSEASYLYTGRDFEKYNPDSLMGRKGQAIYKKMMLDEQVKAVVKFRSDSIVSRQFDFEIDNDSITDEQAEERVKVFQETIKQINGSWTDKIKGILSAIYCGFSMSEIVTNLIEVDNKSWVGLKNIKLRPFDTFTFKVDAHGNILNMVQKIAGREIKINPRKFIHFVVNPDVDEQYGQSELREAYRSWFSKDYAIKFRNMWLERHASGFRYIQMEKGHNLQTNSPNYLALQNIISNIDTSTGAILPSGLELKSDYPANNVAFKEAIEDYNFGIAMALLVPNLVGVTPQTQTGSYSQSEVQIDSYFETLTADIDRLEDALNEQLFRRLGDKNWGDGIYPKYKIKPMSRTQKLKMIELFKELAGSNSVRPLPDDEDYIRKALGFPPVPEDMRQENIDPQGQEGQKNGDDEIEEEDDEQKTGEDSEGIEAQKKAKKGEKDETIMGKGLVTVTAFTKAKRRVDFAVIARTSDLLVDEYTQSIAESMDVIVADLIRKGKGEGSVDSNVSSNIKAIKTDSKMKQQLNRLSSAMLKESALIGSKHAAFEVNKAQKKEFKADYNRLDFIAEDFFKTSAFKITGNLTGETEKIVEQEIMNGSRYDKSWDQIERSIYESMASAGMITLEQAKESLGEALGVTNPDARLRTIVRTSTFDAINNARHAYFTDPKLDDFVQAFEYSAILDARTTDICRHLDEENRGNHTKEWYDQNPEYRPPNHFNAIAEGELVQTKTGLIPIEHIKVGDQVLTHKGRYRKVYAVMGKNNDTSSILKLEISTGDILFVTNEHPILTSNGWFRADEIKVGQNVFQRSEQWRKIPVSGSSIVTQRILSDANNCKPAIDEDLIPYQVHSSTFGVSSSIQFNIDRVDKEIHDIRFNRYLRFIFNPNRIKNSRKGRFMPSRILPVSFRSFLSRFYNIFRIRHRITVSHSFSRFFSELLSCFRFCFSPMRFPFMPAHCFGVKASPLPLRSNRDSVTLTETSKSGFADPHFSLNCSNAHSIPEVFGSDNVFNGFDCQHDISSWFSSSITSIEVIPYNGRVYNLAVEEDETYTASNVLVHNCRSLLIPVTIADIDSFEEGEEPTKQPQKGFR